MSKRVSSLFHGTISGVPVLVACLLALVAFFGGPASAAAAATAEIATVYWKKGTTSGYQLEATVTTTTLAESVTFAGANITTTDLVPTADGGGLVFRGTAATSVVPVVGTAYTLNVSYGEGGPSPETVTARITGVLGSTNLPGLTAPLGGVASTDSPTFHWTAPASSPAGFAGYLVSVSGADSFQWRSELPSTVTSTVYNGAPLAAGATYEWAAAAVDSNGNRAENRNSFVPGANFSGRVTDINGNPLANIEVQAADLSGMDAGARVTTGADGTYIYAGLAPGDYKIHFDFQAYYWKDKLDSASADVLTVTAGAMTSNINAVIRGWGAIAGSVYFPGYKPASGVQVTLLNLSKVPVASVPAVSVPLPASGFANFYLALIRPGTYYLRFSAPGYLPVDKQVVVSLNRTLSGVPEVTHTFTGPLPSTLTVLTSGSGTGTVTSTPVGISCASGSTAGCSSSFTTGTVVTLNATPSLGSVFGGWSVTACTGASCAVTVDAAKSVTATFNTRPATVRIDGSSTPYFSIGAAMDALLNVTTLQTVRVRGENFVENVIVVKPAQVLLKGGYTDGAFTTRTATSKTTIDGTLKIRNGKLTVERLTIK